MRKNEYNEIMRIKEIRLQPDDISNPLGDWAMDVLWQSQHEKSVQWYGCITEHISMNESIKRQVATKEQVELVYGVLAKVADTYHLHSSAISEVEEVVTIPNMVAI